MNEKEKKNEELRLRYDRYWENIQNKSFFIGVYVLIGITILTIITAFILIPYTMDVDREFVNTVTERAYDFPKEGSMTDFSEKSVKELDAQGVYTNKIAKLKHIEIYYIEALVGGLFLGLLIGAAIGSMVWGFIYWYADYKFTHNPHDDYKPSHYY